MLVAEGARDDLRRRYERNVWICVAHGYREAQGAGPHHVMNDFDGRGGGGRGLVSLFFCSVGLLFIFLRQSSVVVVHMAARDDGDERTATNFD